MGLGVAQAIANKGKTGQIKVISVDGNKDAFEAVKSRRHRRGGGAVPVRDRRDGRGRVQGRHRREDVARQVNAPVQVVTKANVDAALASAPKPAAPYEDPFAELAK